MLCEYLFYLSVFYAVMGSAFGISLGSLGIAMNVAMAGFCILRLGSKAFSIYEPLLSVVLCAVAFLTIQFVVHGTSISDSSIRAFVPWVLSLIIIKSLFTRPGFLRRASWAMLFIGASSLPFLNLVKLGERAGLDTSTALSNSNALAEWFAFCALMFTIHGLETRRTSARALYWVIAIGCLFVVGLTVSRGTLVAFALAAVVAVRKRLKRGFLPVLAIAVLGAAAYATGLFDQAIQRYSERGVEETGRLVIWPIVIKRIIASPLTGVPASKFGTALPSGDLITPHNGFLFLALGGGILTLALFMVQLIKCLQGARKANTDHPDSAYLWPLFVFFFLIIQAAATSFISAPWELMACACLHYRPRRRLGRTPLRPLRMVFGNRPIRQVSASKL